MRVFDVERASEARRREVLDSVSALARIVVENEKMIRRFQNSNNIWRVLMLILQALILFRLLGVA